MPKKSKPQIKWEPAALHHGMKLGKPHLNATALHEGKPVPGTWTYSPKHGKRLTCGRHQLTCKFTPQDVLMFYEVDEVLELECGPAPLTVLNLKAKSKVYDGTLTAELVLKAARLDGVVGLDDVELARVSATGSFEDKNVGVGKTVTASLTLTGRDAKNYTLRLPHLRANIDPLDVTVTATSDTRPYDGTPFSTKAPVVNPAVLPDTADFTQAFDSRNAGSRNLIPSARFADGNNRQNYQVIYQSAIGEISRLNIVVAAISDTRTYDGTIVSKKTPAAPSNLVAGDTATFIQTFDTPSAGTRKTLTPFVASLNDGNNGGNYDVITQTADGQITLAIPALKVNGGSFAALGVDGKTLAGSFTPSLAQRLSGTNAQTIFVKFTSADANHTDLPAQEVPILPPVLEDITGGVKSESGAPVIGYTVRLLDVRTNEVVYETTTDSDGRYSISSGIGSYKVLVGEKPIDVKEITIDG